MNYQPAQPDDNVNVSHQHPLREFLLILTGLSALALLVFWALGLAVDLAVDRMSDASVARVHRALAVEIRSEELPAADRARQSALQNRVDALRACAGVDYPVTVQLVRSETPNAVVMPGAHIAVFSGLLGRVRSENGLDFVLAHELAHLDNRDHLRGLGRTLILIAVSAAVTGAHSDLTQLLVPTNQLGMARYSQGRETAADERALDILQCRHGHVAGAAEFFENLLGEHARSRPAIGLSHYFASHPELQSRLTQMQSYSRAQGHVLSPGQGLTPLAPPLRAERSDAG